MDAANLVVLRGELSSDPRRRTLPSGDVIMHLEVTTRGDVTASVPVVADGALGERASRHAAGTEIVVVGHVRRRFFRAGGATRSRTEVVAHRIARSTDRRAVARTTAAALDVLSR